jgi:hypothetical protein
LQVSQLFAMKKPIDDGLAALLDPGDAAGAGRPELKTI